MWIVSGHRRHQLLGTRPQLTPSWGRFLCHSQINAIYWDRRVAKVKSGSCQLRHFTLPQLWPQLAPELGPFLSKGFERQALVDFCPTSRSIHQFGREDWRLSRSGQPQAQRRLWIVRTEQASPLDARNTACLSRYFPRSTTQRKTRKSGFRSGQTV
jgi:hypothetical protein